MKYNKQSAFNLLFISLIVRKINFKSNVKVKLAWLLQQKYFFSDKSTYGCQLIWRNDSKGLHIPERLGRLCKTLLA